MNKEIREEIICHVNQIINKLDEKEKNKIPLSVRRFFEKYSIENKYILDFSKPIKQQIREETEKVLVFIYSYLKGEKKEND